MTKKLMLAVALVIAGGGGATQMLKPETPKPEPPKVDGDVYPLRKEFLVNLKDGRFAKLGVALVVRHDEESEAGGEEGGGEAPEGYGDLAQEPIVRALVTDGLAGVSARDLTAAGPREKLERRLAAQVKRRTDVPAQRVVFTDVVVE